MSFNLSVFFSFIFGESVIHKTSVKHLFYLLKNCSLYQLLSHLLSVLQPIQTKHRQRDGVILQYLYSIHN